MSEAQRHGGELKPASPFAADTVFAALTARLGERASRAAAVRTAHGASESYHAAHPPDIVVFPQSTEEVVAIVTICAAHRAPIVPYGAGTSLEGNARRSTAASASTSRDEQADRGQCRGPRLPRAARHHAQAAQRRAARHRPVLPDRSGRRRLDRRHGVDARLRHHGGALRHHARQRDGARGGARRRPRHPHQPARAQVGRRLRPDAAVRRRRRHARRHHRDHAAAASGAGGDLGGRLPVRHRSRARSRPRSR